MKNKAQLRNDERCQVWIIFICGESAGGRGVRAGGGENRGMRHVQLICKRCVLSLMDPWFSAMIGWNKRMRLRRSFFPVRTDLPYLSQKYNIRHSGECDLQSFCTGKYKPSTLCGFGQIFVIVKGGNWRI